MPERASKLRRKREAMPAFVEEALHFEGLVEDYRLRPDYQQNDYLLWINQAKKEKTKKKRLEQMLEELRNGGVYMKMSHPASAKD